MNAHQSLKPWTRFLIQVGIACAVLLAFMVVYQSESLPSPWQDVIINGSYALAAGWAAFIITRIWQMFAPTEQPRPVWGAFALGLWSWTIGEIVWGIYAIIYGDAFPPLSGADFFYIVGVIWLALALAYQYRQIYHPTRRQFWGMLSSVLVGTLILSTLGASFLQSEAFLTDAWLSSFINTFYPLSDLMLVLGALLLARTFSGGLWARPWLALFIFAAADGLYAWLVSSELYSFIGGGDYINLMTDVLYLSAYLVLALLCQAHLYLLHYGPRWRTRHTPEVL